MADTPTRWLRRLNPYCAQALSAAASLCQSRAHAQISIEHWLLKLLEQGEGDLTLIARRYEWDMDAIWRGLLDHLDTLPRSVQGKPQLCEKLQQLIKNAWLRASLNEDNDNLRSAICLAHCWKPPACSRAKPRGHCSASAKRSCGICFHCSMNTLKNVRRCSKKSRWVRCKRLQTLLHPTPPGMMLCGPCWTNSPWT